MAPSLSVCLIARNEQENLPRVLRSVRDVADQVIVTDTGSTDNSVDIAKRAGAQVEHFNWIDDFSAAHNYCLQFATGDWVFWLDADEELLADSKQELAGCMRRDDADGFYVKRHDFRSQRPSDFSTMWQLRLIRRAAHRPFVGRFHHHFDPPLDRLHFSQITLNHYGYIGELLPAKNRRAAHLLALELQDRPHQFYYLVEYARTLMALQDDKAYEVFVQAAQMVRDRSPQAQAGPLALLLEWILAVPELPVDFPLGKSEARRIASESFRNAIPLLWQIAQQEYQAGRFERCAELLERILELGRTGAYDMLVSFDPAIMRDDAMLNLGVCYTRMANLDRAERCFRALLQSSPRGDEAAANLHAIDQLRHSAPRQ